VLGIIQRRRISQEIRPAGTGQLAFIATDRKPNSRITAMYISLADSCASGFKKWPNDHQPSNDDDQPGGATPVAIVGPPSDHEAPENLPHRPWVVPGVGGSF
jgi:hypothetical protein